MLLWFECSNQSGRIAHDHRIRRDILGNHTPCSDEGPLSNHNISEDGNP